MVLSTPEMQDVSPGGGRDVSPGVPPRSLALSLLVGLSQSESRSCWALRGGRSRAEPSGLF